MYNTHRCLRNIHLCDRFNTVKKTLYNISIREIPAGSLGNIGFASCMRSLHGVRRLEMDVTLILLNIYHLLHITEYQQLPVVGLMSCVLLDFRFGSVASFGDQALSPLDVEGKWKSTSFSPFSSEASIIPTYALHHKAD